MGLGPFPSGMRLLFVKPSKIPHRSCLLQRIWPIDSKHFASRQLATANTGTLELEVASGSQARSAVERRDTQKRLRRQIRTFDPAKLTAGDYADISSRMSAHITIALQPAGRAAAQSAHPRVRICAPSHPGRQGPGTFPPDSRGFFYYRVPAYSPPIGGQLRFRTTSSPDPASFQAGSDLLTTRGLRWNLPLYKIAGRDSFEGVLALLLQDGLVSQRTLELAREAAAKVVLDRHSMGEHPSGGTVHTPVVWAFGQDFEISLGVGRSLCAFVGTDSVFRKRISHLFGFATMEGKKVLRHIVFEGSMVCCFEHSTLPEHTGRRVVVLRVKRLLDTDPVRPRDTIPGVGPDSIEELRPREGELLKTMHNREVRIWEVDVDKPYRYEAAAGMLLRVLFENEKLYGSFQNPEIHSET